MKAWPSSPSAAPSSWALPTTTPASLMPLAELRAPPSVPSVRRPAAGRVDERLPGRRIAAREQPDHLPARVQVPDRAAAGADLGAPAVRRVAVPEEHAGAVGAIGVPADGAVRRDRAGEALRAEPGQLAQVLDAAERRCSGSRACCRRPSSRRPTATPSSLMSSMNTCRPPSDGISTICARPSPGTKPSVPQPRSSRATTSVGGATLPSPPRGRRRRKRRSPCRPRPAPASRRRRRPHRHERAIPYTQTSFEGWRQCTRAPTF